MDDGYGIGMGMTDIIPPKAGDVSRPRLYVYLKTLPQI